MLRWIKDINLSGCCNAIFIQVFVDQIFRIFDKDGNGSIDFKVIKLEWTFLALVICRSS